MTMMMTIMSTKTMAAMVNHTQIFLSNNILHLRQQCLPQMAEAMEKFTFWTQEEIQGYFDQGWDIASLEEWLESQ